MQKQMLLHVNLCKICKLSKSNYPDLAVVLTHPDFNCIRYTNTHTLCVPLRMGSTHTFKVFS